MNTPYLTPPTVPVSRKEKEGGGKRLYLTEAQRGAIIHLDNLANVFLHGTSVRYGGIAPRTKALLLGGTGVGKSSVAKRFAKGRGWGFIAQDMSGWVPIGAHAKPPTLQVLRDHIRRFQIEATSPSGEALPPQKLVVFLDEIDKPWQSTSAVRDSSYTTAILSEALAFLDMDERLLGHQWSRQDLEKLRTCCFVIAAGSFQTFLREAERKARRGALGFGSEEAGTQDFGQFLSDIEALPDEVASRFASPAIWISPPTRADFATALGHIHEDLGIEMVRPLEELLTEATGRLGGVRWLENYVTKLLLSHPPKPVTSDRPPQSKPRKANEPVDSRTFNFFAGDTAEHVRKLNDDAFALRVALAQVASGLHLAASRDLLFQKPDNSFWIYLNETGSFWEQTCDAIATCGLCAEVSSDLSGLLLLINWEQRAWIGIRNHAKDLEALGLLDVWMRAWDLCSRVVQRQSCLCVQVGRGTYQ